MKQYVIISITFYAENANKKKRLEEKELRHKLKPYVVGNGGMIIGDYYKLLLNSELFLQAIRFAKNKRCVDLHVDYINEYSRVELESAKLFLLRPKKTYMQNKAIYKYLCSKCSCRKIISHKQISISKNINCNQSKKLFKIGEGIEELYCVSVALYEIFIRNGIKNIDFTPVIKGDEIKAYGFTPTKECNIISDVYEYK